MWRLATWFIIQNRVSKLDKKRINEWVSGWMNEWMDKWMWIKWRKRRKK